jgi:hypothetical protein
VISALTVARICAAVGAAFIPRRRTCRRSYCHGRNPDQRVLPRAVGRGGGDAAVQRAAGRNSLARQASLLAYFSRPGENYYYGGRRNLRTGNTEVLADMISELIECDVHRIEPADPYSDDYDETVARNVREQNADARPAIVDPRRRPTATTRCCWPARSGTSRHP